MEFKRLAWYFDNSHVGSAHDASTFKRQSCVMKAMKNGSKDC